MNKWLFHQNGLIRTSLSATVTQVSHLLRKMCVFLFTWPRLRVRWIQSLIANTTGTISQSQCTQHVQTFE